MGSKYRFISNHPHAGEFCEPKLDEEIRIIGRVVMWPWRIIDCKHEDLGSPEWCYA